MVAALPENDKVKKPILRWRGVLADAKTRVRMMCLLVLVVAGFALSSTQLGFVHVEIDDSAAHALVMLLPVALASLLLGTLWGTAVGLLAGVITLVHSNVMPLDYYELVFITPYTSILQLTIMGFLFGIMFAFVLRNDPSIGKRIFFIGIVCIVGSWLYSIGFATGAFLSMLDQIADLVSRSQQSEEEVVRQAQAVSIPAMQRFGNVGIQGWLDALLLFVCCVPCDFAARNIIRNAENMSLRRIFGFWLLAVFAVVFMVSSAVSFVAITVSERNAETDYMRVETEFLLDQLEGAQRRADAFTESVGLDANGDDWSDDIKENYVEVVALDAIFFGYDEEEDGLVVASQDHKALSSNSEYLRDNAELATYLPDEIIEAMDESVQSGKAQRVVYDSVHQAPETLEDAAEYISKTQVAFLQAAKRNGQVVMIIKPSDLIFAERGNAMAAAALSTLLLLLAVFMLTSGLLNQVVVSGIGETNRVLKRITEGDLDARVSVGDTKEFASLSEGVNQTVDALQGWISEAESRMDAELATAHTIQESALPQTFPPYPSIMGFDIYATMDAAREVGGDFYDFFLVDPATSSEFAGRVAFVVADVSGKGVPAALYMMKAKTLLRDYLQSGMELGEAVENVNEQLCEGNEAGMFVTAWIAILDYGTGHVDFVNAGHNPPLLWQRDGGWRWLEERSGLPMGLYDGMPYKTHSVDCKAGDTFLVYTDGVTEAFNVEEQLYGTDRLLAVAEEGYRAHPRELIEMVQTSVDNYAQGAEQSDDITILAVEVGVPPEVTSTIEVPANIEEIDKVNDFLHAELDRRLCPKRVQNQLDIAIEELFVNVCKYAYPDATEDNPGIVRVQRTYTAEPASISVDIIDEGAPFDPTAKPDAVTPTDIADVPIGGLGILMVKKTTDEFRYERLKHNNVVTIVKKW